MLRIKVVTVKDGRLSINHATNWIPPLQLLSFILQGIPHFQNVRVCDFLLAPRTHEWDNKNLSYIVSSRLSKCYENKF